MVLSMLGPRWSAMRTTVVQKAPSSYGAPRCHCDDAAITTVYTVDERTVGLVDRRGPARASSAMTVNTRTRRITTGTYMRPGNQVADSGHGLLLRRRQWQWQRGPVRNKDVLGTTSRWVFAKEDTHGLLGSRRSEQDNGQGKHLPGSDTVSTKQWFFRREQWKAKSKKTLKRISVRIKPKRTV